MPLLMILQAIAAAATASPEISPTFTARPTAAARALTVQGVTLPTAPITFTFECLVRDDGRIGDCIDAAAGTFTEPTLYRQRLSPQLDAGESDALRGAARARLTYYRVAPAKTNGRKKRTVLIREIVSPADAAPVGVKGELVPPTLIKIEGGAELDLEYSYPAAALRAGVQTRVGATCHVLEDHSLLCRDARTELPGLADPPPSWRDPTFDAAFEQATPRALAALKVERTLADGRESVGKETHFGLRWVLP